MRVVRTFCGWRWTSTAGTGQPFLLSLMESLRSRLPDVSGLMHMFPFQREYRPETGAAYAG